MNSQKTFGALPLSTINPSKIGAQATDVFDTSFRPLQWDTPPTEENMQQPENTAALYTLLDKLPGHGNAWTNPTVWWRIENRLNMFTSLLSNMSAADTYISVGEASLLKAGYILFIPQTSEQLLVLEVDGDLSESWTNDASAACNVRVDRSILPGPTLAATAGFEVRAGVPLMGEFGEPKEGVVTVPGDPQYNLIQLFGLYIQMSKMQRASLMEGDYGTHEQLVRENESYLSQQLQNTVLFGRRGSYNHDDEGMIYLTNGLIAQLKDNVLSAGTNGNTLTYQNVSNFIDGTFESANSSATKYLASGELLFMHMLNTATQEGKLEENPRYNPGIGVDEFTFTTAGGKSVTVGKMRFAFMGALKDWGIVLDLGNIGTAEYADFGWKWYMDLEAPMQGITTATDALVGSIAVTVKDPDTCGVIKGGTSPVIANRNGLGIVTQF
jgi:hypothetical protein